MTRRLSTPPRQERQRRDDGRVIKDGDGSHQDLSSMSPRTSVLENGA